MGTVELAWDCAGVWHLTLHCRWLERWIDHLSPLHESLVEGQSDDILELDELWSFVGSKAQQHWLWLAICRRTRQVVAYWIGDRSEASAIHLWEQLPQDYARRHSVSDTWEAYRYVFDHKRHRQVNKDAGETNHVERWFNMLRQRLGHFTRKTLSFSKCDKMHICEVGRFYSLPLIVAPNQKRSQPFAALRAIAYQISTQDAQRTLSK